MRGSNYTGIIGAPAQRIKRKSEKIMEKLRLPQIRALKALKEYGTLSRNGLSEKCGLSTLSGTITRVLHGLREGSSSGPAHPGLLTLGLIRENVVELDNEITELWYDITPKGLAALAEAGDVPEPRSRESSTNKRYKESSDAKG